MNSKIYPRFEHKWWLYVPAKYDGKSQLPLMVFQDGWLYVNPHGGFRAPVVLDNLIAGGEIPAMAAIFVEPGATHLPASDGSSPPQMRSNRSVEYDTLNGDYARFLVEEVLAEAQEHVCITDDPDGRGIAGFSSGGICAFTVAWQRPDRFRKVFAHNGSFVNIRGGHVYPDLIRQAEKKPIRVFLQDGANDTVDGYLHLNWPEANKAMAAALKEKDYDYQFVFGEGTHSPAHAAAIFPEVMRWLWRDYPSSNRYKDLSTE